MFYCKQNGDDNVNCRRLKQNWDTLRAAHSDLFTRCLRIHCCIPDVKRNNDENARLWVENDGSIVLYITAKNIGRLFRSDSIDILKQNGYLPRSDDLVKV
jgi:hypothetical protein